MAENQGFFRRLTAGLGRSARSLSKGIGDLFAGRALDAALLDDFEDLLIAADLGPAVAARVRERLADRRVERDIDAAAARAVLGAVVGEILRPVEAGFAVDGAHRPHIVLMVGVNGTGKTTTIAKIAHRLRADGRSVLLAAGDTFRAAAIEQLQVWGQRVGAPVLAREVGADPASIAYAAIEQARAEDIDVVLIDTAGRLQNKDNLMAELAKVVRVVRKHDESAPHDTLLVLDATTGQNALRQIEVFREVAEVSGLVMTKLDGTARGGVLVAAAERFGLPVHFIGIGEGLDDLQPFSAAAFADALTGGKIRPAGS